jgi:hypothetical protein
MANDTTTPKDTAAQPMANHQTPKQKPKKKARKPSSTSLPRPVTRVQISLKSAECQRLFRRLYERTDSALIWLDTVLDKVANHDDLNEADDLIRSHITNCANDLRQQISQMKVLKEDNGLEDAEIQYKNPHKGQVEAQTPLSIQFINLFKLMDELMTEVDVLWFYEVITRDQRKDASNKTRKAISSTSTAIINFNNRAQSLVKKLKEGPVGNESAQETEKPAQAAPAPEKETKAA